MYLASQFQTMTFSIVFSHTLHVATSSVLFVKHELLHAVLVNTKITYKIKRCIADDLNKCAKDNLNYFTPNSKCQEK